MKTCAGVTGVNSKGCCKGRERERFSNKEVGGVGVICRKEGLGEVGKGVGLRGSRIVVRVGGGC